MISLVNEVYIDILSAICACASVHDCIVILIVGNGLVLCA